MTSQKYRKNFRIIPWDFVEVGEEVKVVTQQTIQMLKKTFTGELDYRGIYRFLAKVLSKDDSGLTIHLALAHISRYHLVSEYLSSQDIYSVKIGPDGNTYIVLRKNKYDSLWKKHSVFFAFIDLIDTKSMFKRSSTAVMQLLRKVQSRIDAFAAMHPHILILSFADSLIVKSIWGYYGQNKGYDPEAFLKTVLQLRTLLHQDIGINSYVVITQGQNFIASKGMVHINRMRNHLGMLSFGPPFASLFGIDDAVKGSNISEKRSLYIEKLFYDSLNDKSILDTSTLIRRSFLCPFLKTTNEFIAINLHEVEQQNRDVSSTEEVARNDN